VWSSREELGLLSRASSTTIRTLVSRTYPLSDIRTPLLFHYDGSLCVLVLGVALGEEESEPSGGDKKTCDVAPIVEP
jgi:hypothetical protein